MSQLGFATSLDHISTATGWIDRSHDGPYWPAPARRRLRRACQVFVVALPRTRPLTGRRGGGGIS